MKAIDMDQEALTRAFALIRIAENVDIRYCAEMVAAWLRDDIQQATRVVLALAFLADETKARRQGHAMAQYLTSKGAEIPPEIAALERDYQRHRKANNRIVARMREAG